MINKNIAIIASFLILICTLVGCTSSINNVQDVKISNEDNNESIEEFNLKRILYKTKDVCIEVDGKTINHSTKADTVEELLEELDIIYSSDDFLSKSLDEFIEDGDLITITRITKVKEKVIETIDYEEELVNDYTLEVGETRVIQEGYSGQAEVTYEIYYENGIETKREIVNTEVTIEPKNRIIGSGIFDPYDVQTVVNQKRYLDEWFQPDDLVYPNVRMMNDAGKNMLRYEAAIALEELFDAAEEEEIYLYAVSGYRSYSYQSSIYDPYSGYSAPPGASEHQLGLAMDVSNSQYGGDLLPEFGYTLEGIWVEENAHKYGFVVRYMQGKEHITGYNYEPWHLRYVGVDFATLLYDRGITLEEYYGEY